MLYILARHQDFIKTAPGSTFCLFISFHGSSLIYFNYFDPCTCGWFLFFGGENWQDPPSFNLRFVGKIERQMVSSFGSPSSTAFKSDASFWRQWLNSRTKNAEMATILKGLCSKQLSFLIHNLDGKGWGWKNQTCLKFDLIILIIGILRNGGTARKKKNMPHPTSINPSRNQTSGSSERVFSKMAFRGLKIWMTRMCCENGWCSGIIGYCWNWIGKKKHDVEFNFRWTPLSFLDTTICCKQIKGCKRLLVKYYAASMLCLK